MVINDFHKLPGGQVGKSVNGQVSVMKRWEWPICQNKLKLNEENINKIIPAEGGTFQRKKWRQDRKLVMLSALSKR